MLRIHTRCRTLLFFSVEDYRTSAVMLHIPLSSAPWQEGGGAEVHRADRVNP